jgi:peptide/nickel transport system permease protein
MTSPPVNSSASTQTNETQVLNSSGSLQSSGNAGNKTAAPKSIGFWREVWQRFRKRKLAMTALIFVFFLALVGIFAPFIVGSKPVILHYKGEYYFPALSYFNKSFENAKILKTDRILVRNYDPKRIAQKDPDYWIVWPWVYQDPEARVDQENPFEYPENEQSVPPSKRNYFGTNKKGIDVFASMVYGTSYALLVGFVSTGIAAAIGITLGSLAGYFGGWVDILISRVIEIVLCIPTLILIIAIVAILEQPRLFHVMAVIGLTSWPTIARLTRAEFMKIRQMEYISAARALGAGPFRIIFRHILPNAMAPVLVPITFGIASAILTESALSFLGIGTEGTNSRWGVLLEQARNDLTMWWLVVFPGSAIFLAVLAYNLIGEGLQEATDPRLRNR